MGSTAHFFIPISRTLNVPDGYSKTKKPTGVMENEDGSPTPTTDAAHFVFHQVEVEGSPLINLDASFQRASERAGNETRRGGASGTMGPTQLTVAEAMVEMDFAPSISAESATDSETDKLTAAFDYALSELNVLLRAFAMASNEPIKLVSREALPPMIPLATSDTKPWEMLSKPDLPFLQGLSIFNLNMNIPFVAKVPQSFAEVDASLDAALVNLSNDGPFTAYRDFRREADLNYFEEGNYRIAVILYASSCEALLDELLQHNLWEDKVRPEHAAKRFLNRRGRARGIVDLVKNELQNFYQSKGWPQESPDIIGEWIDNVTSLRNKAIHYGYTPDQKEMRACVDTVNGLVEFIADRVFEARPERPITALALLGKGGLESREGWDESFRNYENSLSDLNVRLRVFQRWRSALSYFRDGNRETVPLDTVGSSCFLVFYPQGITKCFLVHKSMVLAHEIREDEVLFSPETQSSIDCYRNLGFPQPVVVNPEYDALSLGEEPTWGRYVYDIIPGFEVCISTLVAFPGVNWET